MNPDIIDKKIIAILKENSRLSYREIAKKASISPVTALNRVNRLEKEGIIKGYSVVQNYEAMGYDFQIVVWINPAKGKARLLERAMADNPKVSSIMQITGNYQFLLVARFTSKSDLDIFLSELSDDENIVSLKSEFIIRYTKE